MKRNDWPIWFLLLNFWQFERDPKRSSLSFSLIVGAHEIFHIAKKEQCRTREFGEQLFSEIISTTINEKLAFTVPCPFIGPGKNAISLCNPNEKEWRTNADFDEIWSRYGQAIELGNYSVSNKTFHPFDDTDVAWMSEALGVASPDCK